MSLMRKSLALGSLLAPLCAQVTEIPAMTTVSTRVDVDALPVGPTNLDALRGAGSPYTAQIANLVLSPNVAVQGFYNFNVGGGEGLARDATTGALSVVAPLSFFNAFDATIDLQVPGIEFGCSVGDWSGGLVIEFRRRSDNSLVAQINSSQFATVAPKFFQTTALFDRVVIKADSETGNWVLTEFHIPANEPWVSFGTGCAGTVGIPIMTAVTAPSLGDPFNLSINNMPTAGGVYIMTLGTSVTIDSQLGVLPIDLGPLGAPGCPILSSVDSTFFQLQTAGTATFTLPVPSLVGLLGQRFTNQAFVSDAANALGFVASNAGIGTIQP